MAPESSPNVVGVMDLSDVVLASLSSTAAPVLETAPEPETVAAPTVEAKPKAGGTSENVAYVHVPDCIACNACAEACPSEAIVVEDHSVIDPNICNSCNECVPVCPTSCISMQPRSGYAQLEFAIK